MTEIDKTTEVLRRISNFLRSLTDEQIEDLITGKVRLTLTASPGSGRSSKRVGGQKLDLANIREELANKQTREEGFDLLNELALSRSSLQEIAVAMDLPTPKTDTVERLKDRIVDAAIGYRLRSNAIRSVD